MAPTSLNKQTVGHNLPHDWLMSLAMDLAACVICGGENDISGCYLAVLSVAVALAITLWLYHTPYKSACGIGHANKNYLKWWAIQLVIHSTVGV